MRILYRILDWNQKHNSDVFFQQMWGNTAWLAYPESRDDPIKRVHSAPRDLDLFANGLATLLDHLINKRGYTCIKWLSITNEPGSNWSWWQRPSGEPLTIGPGLAAVRKALAQRGLNLPLSGPDSGIEVFHSAIKPGDEQLLGAYDFHDYSIRIDANSAGYLQKQTRDIATRTTSAHDQGKPLFMSEFGSIDLAVFSVAPANLRPDKPEPVLAASEFVIRDANAGVDGFNRWSFLNRGDLDGLWQFVDTWDPKQKKMLTDFTPHANSYFGLGLLSRFTAKHSAVLATNVSNARVKGWQRVFCAAFRSPSGNLTLAVVNDAPEDFALKLSWDGVPPPAKFFRYRYAAPQYDRQNVNVDPDPGFSPTPGSAFTDSLPPNSLTIYSTYELRHDDPGIMVDDAVNPKTGLDPSIAPSLHNPPRLTPIPCIQKTNGREEAAAK
jgi:alpha-galactosidase